MQPQTADNLLTRVIDQSREDLSYDQTLALAQKVLTSLVAKEIYPSVLTFKYLVLALPLTEIDNVLAYIGNQQLFSIVDYLAAEYDMDSFELPRQFKYEDIFLPTVEDVIEPDEYHIYSTNAKIAYRTLLLAVESETDYITGNDIVTIPFNIDRYFYILYKDMLDQLDNIEFSQHMNHVLSNKQQENLIRYIN